MGDVEWDTGAIARMDDPVLAVDRTLTVTRANEAARRAFDADGVPDLPESFERHVRAAIDRDSPVEFEAGLPTGRRVSARAHPGEDGVTVHVRESDGRAGDELFRELLERSHEAIVIADPETGAIRRVNEAACERTGYDRSELLDRSVLDIERQLADREDWQAFVDDVLAADGSYVFEGVQERKDGSTYPIEVSVDHVTVDGRDHLVAISRELGDREQLRRERAARERITGLHAVASRMAAADGVEEIHRLAVESGSEVLGYDAVCLVVDGDPVGPWGADEPFDPGAVAAVQRDGTPSLTTEDGHSLLTTRVGDYGVLQARRDRPDAFDEDDAVAANLLAAHFAESRRRLERERDLERQREFVEDLLDAIPDPFYLLDTEGEFRRWNRRFTAVTGYDDEELGSMHATELVSEEDEDSIRAAIRQVVEDGTEEYRETKLVTKAGERIPYEFNGARVTGPDGQVIGVAGIGRNLTDRQRRQRQLESERERLEYVNRLLRHNLLNDLNVVQARLGILEGAVDEEARPHYETAKDRTADMVDLVDTIRRVTTAIVDSDDGGLHEVAVVPLVESELDRARQAFPHAEFAFTSDGDPAVLADDLFGEVIENLLTNAVQHNDREHPDVAVRVERGGEDVLVRIADDGPGIPDDRKEAVFEQGVSERDAPGSGVGLYLVRKTVETYRGSVTVADNDPRGTVVEMRIPAADAPPER